MLVRVCVSVWQQLLSRLRNAFRNCPETRWCYHCGERVPCQLGYGHRAGFHLHVPDPFNPHGHELKWFVR